MKNKIMLYVFAIYLWRKLKAPFVTEAVIFLILVTTLLFFVSVPSVLTNMLGSEDLYQYFMNAFSSTDFAVQAVLVLGAATLLFFVKNMAVRTVFKERFA